MSLKVRVIHSGAFNRLARLGKENHPSWEYDVTEHPKNPLHWVINDGSGVTIPKEDCQVIEEVETPLQTPTGDAGIRIHMVEQACEKCNKVYGLFERGILKECPSCSEKIGYASVIHGKGEPEIQFLHKEEKMEDTPSHNLVITNWYVENDGSDELKKAFEIISGIKYCECKYFVSCDFFIREKQSFVYAKEINNFNSFMKITKEQVIKMAEPKHSPTGPNLVTTDMGEFKITHAELPPEMENAWGSGGFPPVFRIGDIKMPENGFKWNELEKKRVIDHTELPDYILLKKKEGSYEYENIHEKFFTIHADISLYLQKLPCNNWLFNGQNFTPLDTVMAEEELRLRKFEADPRDGFIPGPFVEGEKESDPEKEADAFEKMSVSEQRSAHKKFLRDIEKRENEKNKSWAKEQEEKTINSIKKQIQDEFERIDKNILESFRKEKLGEPYTSQGFINLIKAQGDVSLSDAVKNINNQTLVVIPPTEKEVMDWIKMHDENIGYDHNTKLAIFAFYYWMKSQRN